MGILADLGLDDEEMAEIAKKLLESKIWLDNNHDTIGDKYVNKFVAIENNQIIESDEDIDILIKRLKKKKKNIDRMLIDFINPKDAQLII